MAEIIDSEKIRQSLIAFDGYIKQSIEILQTLKGIKDDSEKMFSALQVKDKIVSQIEGNLKKLQEDAKNITDKLSQFKENKAKEITDFINKHRQEAETFKSEIVKFKEQNSHEITDFINKYANEVDSQFAKINSENNNFKTQIKEAIDSAKKDNDKQISDFLYKQNALVSNLNQQIDSYHKLTETLKVAIESQAEEIKSLKNISDKDQKQIELLKAQNIDFKNRLGEIMNELKKPLVKKLFGGK